MVAAGGGKVIIFSDLLTGESSTIHAYVHIDGPGETHWVKKQKTKPQTKQHYDSRGGTSEGDAWGRKTGIRDSTVVNVIRM